MPVAKPKARRNVCLYRFAILSPSARLPILPLLSLPQDYVDLGYGYDTSDSFVDDADAVSVCV